MSKRDDAINAVLSAAKAEVGVRESPLGSNTGKRIREFQAADTLGGSFYPWCASFTAFCIEQAEKKLGYPVKYLRSASCDLVLAWARENDLLRERPERGDTFLVMKSRHDATHTGLVASVRPDGAHFGTVEGNTNDGGSREGIGVFARSRPVSERCQFVRWADLLSDADEPDKWAVVIGPHRIAGYKVAGQVLVAARLWAEATGAGIGWNQEDQAVYLNGRPVPAQPRFFDHEGTQGMAFLPVRLLAEATGYKLSVNMTDRRVDVWK